MTFAKRFADQAAHIERLEAVVEAALPCECYAWEIASYGHHKPDCPANHRGKVRALVEAEVEVAYKRGRAAENTELREDAQRYERLRILGCAPGYSKHLDQGHVLRFTNLDKYVDADRRAYPNRGDRALPDCPTCGGSGEVPTLADEETGLLKHEPCPNPSCPHRKEHET